MGELQLFRMKAAFDEIMATAVKRQPTIDQVAQVSSGLAVSDVVSASASA